MVTLEFLREYGANVDEGLARCMNMESFYLGYENCKRISETEGRAEGLAEGRAEGKIEGRIDALSTCIAVAVRKYGVTIDQAIDDYAVPEDIREEIRRRAEALLKE